MNKNLSSIYRYDCRNLGTSPKINTNFKFKQIKNKANQLRVSF